MMFLQVKSQLVNATAKKPWYGSFVFDQDGTDKELSHTVCRHTCSDLVYELLGQ